MAVRAVAGIGPFHPPVTIEASHGFRYIEGEWLSAWRDAIGNLTRLPVTKKGICLRSLWDARCRRSEAVPNGAWMTELRVIPKQAERR